MLGGKVAIVTGAGLGIGREEALALATHGARVLVNDLAPQDGGSDNAAETVRMIRGAGGEAVAFHEDVGSFDAGRRIVEAALDAFGRLDILVNNAGFARPASIAEMTEEEWHSVIAVHLTGHFATTRHAAPIFRDQRSGVIVNTASESGLGHLGMANYAAAKEGIVAFTKSVARELAQYGVRCNAIRPRALTNMGSEKLFETLTTSQDVLGFPIHGNRWVNLDEINPPAQVGQFVAWLCSDASRPANGETFFVGGGTVGLYSDPEIVRSMHDADGWTPQRLSEPAARAYLLDGVEDRYSGKAARREGVL
ncbi:SDR family NAD(P)-dependent oxidoreductase [Novosphingobium sp. 9U]|uniref:SDR family NAD(P)-dependent oxidoreductase n=1 Tax=Novosphingobium sp. 9U TaxID=2653158 RepID=UPI0012F1A1F8|nr:SDR family NAD(P)-dependent oxidoreductase [Novosphingobium sp. 9U]VWX50124.1 Short-chain dehydrogenase [Novosphingobium sp. 9U]